MSKSLLTPQHYAPYYGAYLALAPDDNLLEALEIAQHQLIRFAQEVPMEKIEFVYAENKWTLKDIIQHIIDVERVFAYRALCIARNDQTPLPGFDENAYVVQAQASRRSLQGLLSDFASVRQASLALFASFSTEEFLRMGTASDYAISPLALGYIIIGHQLHHMQVYEQRYL